MTPVFQLDASGTCGQCCVATLAGITLAEAISIFGHGCRGGTITRDVARALRQLGFVCESRLRECDDSRPSKYLLPGRSKVAKPVTPMHLLPPTCIVFVYYVKDRMSHWVLWHDGLFFCPTDGVCPRWIDGEVHIKSYLTVHKIPTPERVQAGVAVMREDVA